MSVDSKMVVDRTTPGRLEIVVEGPMADRIKEHIGADLSVLAAIFDALSVGAVGTPVMEKNEAPSDNIRQLFDYKNVPRSWRWPQR